MSISPTDEQIAALAFQSYEDEGRPEGRAEEHWQRAVASLQDKPSSPERSVIEAGGEEFP